MLHARLLLDGLPGRSGFVFHDGHNQAVHHAAPGLLGLIEGRLVIGRWKPRSLAWLDGTDHFFDHLSVEFAGEPSFVPLRRELETILDLDAPWRAKNGFLFQYLGSVTRELERAALPRAARTAPLPAMGRDISLDGVWTVRRRTGENWVDAEMTVPVNWELVPGIDDYAGTMRFTRTFALAEPSADRIVSLRLGGVDYFADVWLNGWHLGGHEGYFEPFEMDVTPYLRAGANVLRVAVTSPDDPSGRGTHVTSGWHDFSSASAFPNRKSLVKGTLGHHDAKRGGAWSSITGQDGNTGGIWSHIRLAVRAPVHFAPEGVRVTTLSTTPDRTADHVRAAIRTTLRIRNATATRVQARLLVRAEPANFEGPGLELVRSARLDPGDNDIVVAGTLSPLRLWNPADHGFAHLYDVTAVVEIDGAVSDQAIVQTGFRTLSVGPIGESTGPDGAFVVNGRPTFVRGTNLLPTYWLSEYSEERVDRDFAMLRAGGFNAVLVHNLVAPRHFYERADRNGFLVVQMFPLQWSYDQSDEVVASMTSQIRAMARLLHNHPSVVSYEVHNEPDMRVSEDIDNRLLDFDLHAVLRQADPSRWVTTFSSGNHAYPGQFYPLRDDNAFVTLPARFLEEEVHGRRISRHTNMPTEFGIQAMPHVELFRELVAEDRVRGVLERLRNDPKWLAAGAESWADASKTIDEARDVLGRGRWSRVLRAFDWSLLWDLGDLGERIRRLETSPISADDRVAAELLSLKLAVLLLDVLHYGGFKGENFWFGLWKPASSLESFVGSGQDRQYRLHKDAIENYLNAGAVGPIVGYFSFMFRDADWEAPTWGVVDAAWAPKKAYRAYLESNQAVRATLPQALRSPVKLPGDPWVATHPEDLDRFPDAPWAGAEVIVANDTCRPLPAAEVAVWVEDAAGARLSFVDHRLTVDLPPGSGVAILPGSVPGGLGGTLPHDLAGGTYALRARVSSVEGETLSTNAYELVVPDTTFAWLDSSPARVVEGLLDGAAGAEGFHYWRGGAVVHRTEPGLRGFLAGWNQAPSQNVDLYETVQGEHLFRHLLDELDGLPGAEHLRDDLWTIRSEVVSPAVKARTLLRYVELFVRRAEALLATRGRRPSKRTTPGRPGSPPRPSLFPAVGRDIKPTRPVRLSRAASEETTQEVAP